MPAHLRIFLLFILMAGVSTAYAAGDMAHIISNLEIRTPCRNKIPEKVIPPKAARPKPGNLIKSPAQTSAEGKINSSADTFETLITPFLKAVSPHFYDKIIRREKPSTVQS